MTTRTPPIRWLAITATLCLAGCVETPQRPAPIVPQSQPSRASPDWFQRHLADARHARAVHLAAGDTAGARRAYAAVMVPACERVERSGPDKYRARCRNLLHTAKAPAIKLPSVEDTACDLDRDDSNDTPEQITACSD
jgi:hypothetical protein